MVDDSKHGAQKSTEELIASNQRRLGAKASFILASALSGEDIANHSLRADNVKRAQIVKLVALVLTGVALLLVALKFFFLRE